jgi:cell division protein ZapA
MSQFDVTIMGQSYRLNCKEGEESILQEAAAYLNERMCGIRDAGKVKGNDRIAVMAALGMSAELLMSKTPEGPLSALTLSEVKQKIAAMHSVLDNALAAQENPL